jgi:hypothetical protein
MPAILPACQACAMNPLDTNTTICMTRETLSRFILYIDAEHSMIIALVVGIIIGMLWVGVFDKREKIMAWGRARMRKKDGI